MNDLSQINVLVTRPREDAQTLLRDIELMGGSGVLCPMISIKPLLPAASREKLQQLDLYQHIIFTSQYAVTFSMSQIKDWWPQMPVATNWYAVGEKTAARLMEFDIKVLYPACSQNSEALLTMLSSENMCNHRIIIVKGKGGRALLKSALVSCGAVVDSFVCYCREPVHYEQTEMIKIMLQHQINVIVATSCEIIDNLVNVVKRSSMLSNFLQKPFLVPSQRVAQYAENQGFCKVFISRSAGNDAITEALVRMKYTSGWIET